MAEVASLSLHKLAASQMVAYTGHPLSRSCKITPPTPWLAERFVSEDPARQGKNWFVYCANNPISFTDKSGKDIDDEYNDWWYGHKLYFDAFMFCFGAALSRVAAAVSIIDALWLNEWFSSDIHDTDGHVVLGAVLSGIITTCAGFAFGNLDAMDGAKASSPLANVLGIIAVHYGFLSLFMDLEKLSDGKDHDTVI